VANGLAQSELGVIVFSGSAPRQEALESTAWGNGAFTKALVEGLAGLADAKRHGFVTHVALDGYVTQAVTALTAGRQTPITAVPRGIADYPVARVAPSSTTGAVPADAARTQPTAPNTSFVVTPVITPITTPVTTPRLQEATP
jgi:uncharacterized caspase-like protein